MEESKELKLDRKDGVTRRSLVKGGLAVGAVAAVGTALAGCGGGQARSQATSGASASSGVTAGASGDGSLPDAEPIAPLEVPSSWDDEVDVVSVGMGGGGIASALYCAEAGLKVIGIEKEASVGGATQHACGWFTLPGGGKDQTEMKYAYPEFPLDRQKFIRAIQPYYQYNFDDDLLWSVAKTGGEVIDWVQDHGVPMICMGPVYLDARIQGGIQPLGMRYVVQDMAAAAEKAGAEIRTRTTCVGIVQDETGRVVGVKTQSDEDGEKFIKAEKGVILCTGSFGANKDMLAKYAPSALRTAAVGGPFPFATGDGQRMAIGAGADVAGIDSWCAWEAYPYRGDGNYWTFHWDGSVILCRQPWLTIDKMGNRYGYYTSADDGGPVSFGGAGDYINAATQMSRMGGGGYCIFDGDYEKHMEVLAPEVPFSDDRHPLTEKRLDDAGIKDKDVVKSLCALNWQDDVELALERGDIKKADTLEELAEQLEMDPEILKKAVDEWNATCKKGKDDDSIWPYKPEWLIPIEKAPYYGAKISGGIGKTFCGPRVTSNLEVVDTDGHVIPGLYAHFMTAGGICGENFWNGTMFNTTIQGGNAMSWISGYMAAKAIVGN